VRSEGFYVNEKSTDTSWDPTSDLPNILYHKPLQNSALSGTILAHTSNVRASVMLLFLIFGHQKLKDKEVS